MDWKKYLVILMIGFVGMWCIITVDRQCYLSTGYGGKAGISLCRNSEGNMELCIFGIEGEIGL